MKKNTWEGGCTDTGASRTVIGKTQAKLYCRYMGVKFKPNPNKHLYQFGNDVQTSLGSIKIRIPINNDKVIIVDVDNQTQIWR